MSNSNLPEIRIKDAWLLRQHASTHLHELWAKENEILAGSDRMKEIVNDYQTAWKPYEKKILTAMCDELGLSFRQNIIDVNIAPWFAAFSDPLVIGVKYDSSRFVEVLTHELLHRLLTDNKETSYDTEYLPEWKKIFGTDHDFNVLVHIPVHAVFQAIFDDHLHEPARTLNDRELCRQWPAYDKSWAYVEEKGYKNIVKQLSKLYKDLEKT